MSRIDEALRRAQTQHEAEPAPAVVPQAEAAAVADDTETTPWAFEEAAPRARTAAAAPPPQPPQPRVTPTARIIPGPPQAQPQPERRASVPPPPPQATEEETGLAVFRGFDKVVAEKLVVTPNISNASVEQYRKLAATLHHAQADRGIKTVLVASAVAGEGKTLTSTNLALTFSESYKREVLLIDADLRRPSLHDVFQIPNVSGLTDGLNAAAERKLSIVQVSPRLSVLTAGKPDPDPMGNLTSPRMRRILDEAAERFDWVIIDTPPVGIMTDANLLAAMVDAALLVVNAGKTPYQVIQTAVQALGRDKVMGVVLNRVETDALSDGYAYSYKGYYGYGYRTGR
jgi:capsular exopolysaccharide synthesis family protein